MDVVDDLVTAPFRDIVEKGKKAIENAGDTQLMLKASQTLVREGERALRRIEPLCKKNLAEYGSNFIDALKENGKQRKHMPPFVVTKLTSADDIAQYRSELNELLWEFDDFIEVDEFDAEKFTGLQGMSRKNAPKICDILMRMKLEPAPRDDPVSPRMTESPQPLSVVPAIPASPITPAAAFDALEEDVRTQLRDMMGAQSGPDQGLEVPAQEQAQVEPPTPVVEEVLQEPPRPPSANPWDLASTPILEVIDQVDTEEPVERRRPVTMMDSPTLPASNLAVSRMPSSGGSSYTVVETGPMVVHLDDQYQLGNSYAAGDHRNSLPSRVRGVSTSSSRSQHPTIPEDSTVRSDGMASMATPPLVQSRLSQTGSVYSQGSLPSRQRSIESIQSSVFDSRRPDAATSPTTTDNRFSMMSSNWGNDSTLNSPVNPHYRHNFTPPIPHTAMLAPHPEHSGLQAVAPATQFDDGPIPVDTEPDQLGSRPLIQALRRAPTLTIGINSSFYRYKGFCEGAKEVARGGLGIKETRKPAVSFLAHRRAI
jgi:hypothetical protein